MSSIVQRPRACASAASSAIGDRLGEADDPVVARVDAEQGGGLGADGALVVGQPGPVGRADLAEPGAGDLEDLGEAEAPADLDELAARDDHLAAERPGPAGPAPSPRRCC